MKLSTNVVHTITFSVQAFWNEEGGMGQDQFGSPCDSLNSAVVQLDLANMQHPKTGWVIVCDVTKEVQQGKQP